MRPSSSLPFSVLQATVVSASVPVLLLRWFMIQDTRHLPSLIGMLCRLLDGPCFPAQGLGTAACLQEGRVISEALPGGT